MVKDAILPDFLSGEGGVVPYFPGELDTLLRRHAPPVLLLGGVPILNCTVNTRQK